MRYKMQMPPYLKEKPEEVEVLSEDKDLDGLLSNKHVFIDISRNVLREVSCGKGRTGLS